MIQNGTRKEQEEYMKSFPFYQSFMIRWKMLPYKKMTKLGEFMRYKEALERFKRSKVTNRDIGRRNK
jgi:hypothetical protein